MRILLVEDEPRVAHFIAKGLREQSYAVDLSTNGEAALYQIEVNVYDLIILDVMLPQKNGLEVCREIRKKGERTPVLILTARDAVDDRVLGLDSGADDYLTKPFEFKELLARMRALLRRPAEYRPDVLQIADLRLDTADHSAARAGRTISLTAKEYSLLELFLLRAGRVLTREEIASRVWDENFDPASNIIDVYVRRLRRKIDEGFDIQLIHTRRGEGYILVNPGESSEGVPDV